MSSAEDLQRAIQAARAGRNDEARDLLIDLVEAEPRNEMAWMWLSGLVDSLEDKIIACENVLTINPANEKVQLYLTELQKRHEAPLARKKIEEAERLLNQAKAHAERNEPDAALRLARQALEKQEAYEEAWLLISRVSPDLDQQIAALEKAYQLTPSNTETVRALKQARYLKTNPMNGAARLEQMGKFDEALKVYAELASKTKNSQEFDRIYKEILRIERLQDEKIRYVAPASAIARLTLGWPVLYLSLVLIQAGLNPFAHFVFNLWMGLPLVILGGFLLSLAEVRSYHTIWRKLFDEHGDGSGFARLVTAAIGWFLVLVPHVLVVLDSLNRLQNFKIPAMPG
ncbi:MAG: tetratricopeptide repeat protein [Anaerolineales bacterium]